MSREDLATRVLAWLLERGASGWIEAGGPSRLELCEQWRDVSATYGAESPPALGCLLALVREAWGWQVYTVCLGDDGWHVVCPEFGPASDSRPLIGDINIWGSAEAESLTNALEAAPK